MPNVQYPFGLSDSTPNAPWNQEPSGNPETIFTAEEKARLKVIYDDAIARIEAKFGK